MNNTTAFIEGATLTLLDGTEIVSATITQLSKRCLELSLVQPYPLLFDLSRPRYFSRFLLGDGFLRPRQGLSKRTLASGDTDLQGPLR